MGNNTAYTTWEHTVITLYDSGALTLELLDKISEEWRGTDIDSGGSRDIQARDGLYVFEIVVKLVNPDFVANDDDLEAEDYWDHGDEFSEIRHTRWGWR